MRLFNKTIDRELFKQYALGSDLAKQEVVVKIFNPVANGTWFILNSDPQDPDYLWAIVDLGYGAEVGSVSRSELENYRGRFGLGFERDLGFDPINAEELYQGLRNGEYYADGGEMKVKDTWQNIFEEFGFKKGKSMYGLDMYYKRGYIGSVDYELRNVELMFEDDVIYKGYSIQGLLSELENQFGKRNFADGGSFDENIELKDVSNEYGEKYEVFVNGILQGNISKSDDKYFVNSALTRGGKSYPSKFFESKDKAKKYIYSKTKDLYGIGYVKKLMGYADGGNIQENKPYVFYFYYDGNEMTFNTLEKALKEAKQYGVNKVRDDLGGEYFLNFADGGQIEVVYERRADFKKKPIKLLLLSRGKEQKGYTFSGKDQVAVLDNYNRNKQEDLEKLWNLKGYETKYADGGDIANFSDNQLMIMNQNVEVEHHHEELEDILEDEIPVPAWVVAKMETATQNLSDITHYLDGEKELMEDEMEDENEEEDEDQDEIENKIVVEPINVSAGTKTDLTKSFTDDAFGNLRGFLNGMNEIELRNDYTFDYKDEQFEVEPIVNSDENGVSNAVFTIFDGDGEEVGEVAYSREGGKQKFTANSEFFSWNNAKFEDGGFMNDVYADGGYFDGAIPKTSSYMSTYAKGGSLGTVNPKYKNSILSMINYKINKRVGDSMSDISYTEALNLKNKINKDEPISSQEKKYISEMASYLSSKRLLDKVADISYTESFDFFDNIVSMAKGGEVAKGEILGLKRNFMGTTDVEMKISGMRKPQSFIVYPIGKDDSGDIITIQSETRIGKIDLSSGRGLMSQSHSNGAYFVHFQMDKLTPFTISESDLEELKMQIFKTAGDNVGSRGIVSDNSGASRIFAKGGGFDYEYDAIAYGKTKGKESVDWHKELREYVGSNYSKLTAKEKEEIISDMQRNWDSSNSFAKGGGVDDYISMKRLLSEFKNEKEIFDGQIVNRGTNDFKIENDNFYIKRPNENWKIFRKIKYADGGGFDYEYDAIAYAKTKGKENVDWDKELRDYAGSEYSKLTTKEKEEIISDMQRDWDSSHSYSKGGMVVTSVKDIPNFKERLEQRRITYRGLGMGKVADDFYKLAGTSGTRIKVDGKEYFITDEEFNTFSRDADGKMQIRFDAPARKGYADGGFMNDVYEDGGFLDKYEVDRFKQVMNGKAIAKYIVRLQDSFGNKETYVFGIKIKDQFKGCELVPYESLYGGWSNSGTAFSLDNLQVEKLVPNKFFNIELDEQETEMLVNKLVKNNQAGVEKYLNSVFFYLSYKQSFKDVLRGHLALSVAKIVSVEFEIVQKFADGGFMNDVYAKGGGIDYHKFYEVSASTKNGYDLYKINGIEDQDVFIGNYKSIKEANQAGEKLALEKRPMWLRYGKGGVMSNFDKLSAKVAKNYEGKPVQGKFQEEYGKVYSKAEAKEVGDKVAGKVKAMQPAKKEMGGETKKRSGSEMLKQANILAKKIRKDGESWNDAKKRAFAQLKK